MGRTVQEGLIVPRIDFTSSISGRVRRHLPHAYKWSNDDSALTRISISVSISISTISVSFVSYSDVCLSSAPLRPLRPLRPTASVWFGFGSPLRATCRLYRMGVYALVLALQAADSCALGMLKVQVPAQRTSQTLRSPISDGRWSRLWRAESSASG